MKRRRIKDNRTKRRMKERINHKKTLKRKIPQKMKKRSLTIFLLLISLLRL